MPNNWDWIYATYFKLETTVTLDTIIGYFDGNGSVFGAGDVPFDPAAWGYQMNIFSAYQDDPNANPNSWMPTNTGSFLGDVLTSSIYGGGAFQGGTFSYSDTGVDRVFDDGTTDDIYRLTYSLSSPVTLNAGEYFFSHSAVVPEPGTLLLVGLGLAGFGLRRHAGRN